MFGNPVQGPRIVPFGQARTASDYLPNGRPAFRVTQRFTDWDSFFRNRLHGALDIANFNCGDVVLAMDAGHVVPLADPNGAIGIEIQHANGYRSQYWHLSRRAVQFGSVRKGQVIGYVGSSGIVIAGCHLHLVVITPAGNPVDPWPLLEQNAPTPPTSSRVPWNRKMLTEVPYNGVKVATRPNVRARPGGTVVGVASPRTLYQARQIEKKGPGYRDWRNGTLRYDWVECSVGGKWRWMAKAFLVTK